MKTQEELLSQVVMTVPEAARLLGLSRDGASDAARRGEIPTTRFGRVIRVPTAELRKIVGLETVIKSSKDGG